MIDKHYGWNKSIKPLILGFVTSLVLVFVGYYISTHHYISSDTMLLSLFGIAIVQALIQLLFFLHLRMEKKPRWGFIIFLFLLLLLIIIVGGSIWIMMNLNYNLMPNM